MAAELKTDYALAASELPRTDSTFPDDHLDAVVLQYDVRTGKTSHIEDLKTDDAITVEKCGKEDFKYFVIAPRLANGMALFGELDKFVTVSETRFVHVDQSGNRVFATLTGTPTEVVKVSVYNIEDVVTVDCNIGPTGYATLAITEMGLNCTLI